jgi:hypothetical protein
MMKVVATLMLGAATMGGNRPAVWTPSVRMHHTFGHDIDHTVQRAFSFATLLSACTENLAVWVSTPDCLVHCDVVTRASGS